MTSNTFEELSEFIYLKEVQEEETFFNRERSLLLINKYKLYKPRLGSFAIKTMKKMWEITAREISNEYRITVSATKRENRYKILKRNYKKVIDNNNKTAHGKKTFEFEAEMDDIYANKTNINPVILLSSDKCLTPVPNLNNDQENEHTEVQLSLADASISDTSKKTPLHSRKRKQIQIQIIYSSLKFFTQRYKTYQTSQNILKLIKTLQELKRSTNDSYTKRNNILIDMKNELKNYYIEKLEIEKEKLKLAKQKMLDREKRTVLMEQHLKENNNGSLL